MESWQGPRMGAAGAGVSGQATAGLVPIPVGPPRRPGSQERRRGRVVWQLPPARGRAGSPGVSGRRPLSHPPCPGLAVAPCPAPPALGPPKLHPLRTWRHGHHGGTSLAAFPSLAVGSVLGFWGAAGDLSHSEFPAMGCCPLFCLFVLELCHQPVWHMGGGWRPRTMEGSGWGHPGGTGTLLWGLPHGCGAQEGVSATRAGTLLWGRPHGYRGLREMSPAQGRGACYKAAPLAMGAWDRDPPAWGQPYDQDGGTAVGGCRRGVPHPPGPAPHPLRLLRIPQRLSRAGPPPAQGGPTGGTGRGPGPPGRGGVGMGGPPLPRVLGAPCPPTRPLGSPTLPQAMRGAEGALPWAGLWRSLLR